MSRPFAFFEFVTHYGGSNKSTVLLSRELQKLVPVVVVDAYGTCPEYLQELDEQGTPWKVAYPGIRRPTIGGSGVVGRAASLLVNVPAMAGLIYRLQVLFRQIRPQAIWVNSEKAMFAVCRAVGSEVPIAMYVRGEFGRIRPYLKADWGRLAVVVGNSSRGVESLRRVASIRRIEVIPNGIDIDELRRRAMEDPGPLAGTDSPLRIGMAASLLPLKNHALAIRAFARYCASGRAGVLWVCGDLPNAESDPFVDDLSTLPARLGIGERVHFLGWRRNVPAVLARADVVALTSETEGMPRSVMEGMALGKAVVATQVGGVPELIRNDVEGILIPRGDENALVAALRRLEDPQLRARLGRAAASRIQTDYRLDRQARRFHDLMVDITPCPNRTQT